MAGGIPKQENGFIATLNRMGYMTTDVDPFTQKFISFALSQTHGLPLEIGAAYGLASKALVAHGMKVLTNDLDSRHLDLFIASLPPEQQSLVIPLPGDITQELNIKQNSLSAVLACRVFHFFSGEAITSILQKMTHWLLPGGRLYIVTETPYLKNIASFIPIFEERKANKVKYPGEVHNVQELDPVRGAALPPMMHFFDKETLTTLVAEAGFEVIECEMFPRPNFPKDLQYDGRESVGIIAQKPNL